MKMGKIRDFPKMWILQQKKFWTRREAEWLNEFEESYNWQKDYTLIPHKPGKERNDQSPTMRDI
jgi:hypothetical protein